MDKIVVPNAYIIQKLINKLYCPNIIFFKITDNLVNKLFKVAVNEKLFISFKVDYFIKLPSLKIPTIFFPSLDVKVP